MSAPIRVLLSGGGRMGRLILEALDSDQFVAPVGWVVNTSGMSEPIRVLVSGGGKMGRVIVDAVDADASTAPVGVVDALGIAKFLGDGPGEFEGDAGAAQVGIRVVLSLEG